MCRSTAATEDSSIITEGLRDLSDYTVLPKNGIPT